VQHRRVDVFLFELARRGAQSIATSARNARMMIASSTILP
jgi:hypothetical protein